MKSPSLLFFTCQFAALIMSSSVLAETLWYKGDMEIISSTGASCNDNVAPGKHFATELIVKREHGKIVGYLSGENMATGRIDGGDFSSLKETTTDGTKDHKLTLQEKNGVLTGELNEVPDDSGSSCYFDKASVSLKLMNVLVEPVETFKQRAAVFDAQLQWMQGNKMSEEARFSEAIPFFEAASKYFEAAGESRAEDAFFCGLYLSENYIAVGRYEEGFSLQERLFKTPYGVKLPARSFTNCVRNTSEKLLDQLMQRQRTGFALEIIEKTIDRYPDNSALLAIKAKAFYGLDRNEDANKLIEKTLKKFPRDEDIATGISSVLSWRADRLVLNEEHKEALAMYRKAFLLSPSDELCGRVLDGYAFLGEFTEGHKFLAENEQLIAKSLGTAMFGVMSSRLYLSEGNQTEKNQNVAAAEGIYRKGYGKFPSPYLAIALARVRHKLGRYPETVRILNDHGKYRCKSDDCRNTINESLQKEAMLEKVMSKTGKTP